jgi:hypothetical protein
MPKKVEWTDASEEALWELTHKYKDDYVTIAIELERGGWYYTPAEVHRHITKMRSPSMREYVGVKDEIARLATCKPWR